MILSAIAAKLKRRAKDNFKGRHFEGACRKVFPAGGRAMRERSMA